MENVVRRRWFAGFQHWLQSPGWLVLILIVGVLARVRHYGVGLSYWYDEAFLLMPIYERSAPELLGPLPTQTIIAPFFLWLLRGTYLLAGPGELAMRLPALLAGILGLFLLIPMAIRLVGRPAGLWVAALAALSHHHLMHSAEVRAYTVDFLATVVVLWAACAYLQAQSVRGTRMAGGALLGLALVAPWFSFPSVLVFGAVSMSLFVDKLERGDRVRWRFWFSLQCMLVASVSSLWFIQARHMYYPGLVEHFRDRWDAFPAALSLPTVASWSLRSFIGLTSYASTGLGIPLLLLSVWGGTVLWRHSRPIALLTVGPIFVTYAAALVSKYPFSDRTIFFLAPCVWCLSMRGLADLWQRLAQGWGALIPATLLSALLAVSFVKLAKDGLRPTAKAEFREALCFVQQHRTAQDEAFFGCTELNRVYFGHVFPAMHNPSLEVGLSRETLAARLRGRRVWLVASSNGIQPMAEPFRQLPMRETLHKRFHEVEVIRFDAVQE